MFVTRDGTRDVNFVTAVMFAQTYKLVGTNSCIEIDRRRNNNGR